VEKTDILAAHDKCGDDEKLNPTSDNDSTGELDEVDDLMNAIGTPGIEFLVEDNPLILSNAKVDAEPETDETVQLDLSPSETTSDPVRLYLREMGAVPLLTRQGEVEIAKRLECGQIRIMKAVSRSSIVIQEVMKIGHDLKQGIRSMETGIRMCFGTYCQRLPLCMFA